MTTTVNHWINNEEFVSTSGRTAPVYDPALGVETKRVALANGAEINAAIAAAKASGFLKEALGEEMHRTFIAVKAAEYTRVARTISDVDYDLYLHTI